MSNVVERKPTGSRWKHSRSGSEWIATRDGRLLCYSGSVDDDQLWAPGDVLSPVALSDPFVRSMIRVADLNEAAQRLRVTLRSNLADARQANRRLRAQVDSGARAAEDAAAEVQRLRAEAVSATHTAEDAEAEWGKMRDHAAALDSENTELRRREQQWRRQAEPVSGEITAILAATVHSGVPFASGNGMHVCDVCRWNPAGTYGRYLTGEELDTILAHPHKWPGP